MHELERSDAAIVGLLHAIDAPLEESHPSTASTPRTGAPDVAESADTLNTMGIPAAALHLVSVSI